MTNHSAALVLNAVYGPAMKQLLDLVMAAEKAFDDYGKISIFGKDKGKAAEQKFTTALVHAILALVRIGKLHDSKDAEQSFTALQNAMSLIREAYPNWPRAYRYWDDFYAETYNK